MAERTARLYARGDAAALLGALLRWLAPLGVGLRHPERGEVIRIAEHGESLATSADALGDVLRELGAVSLSLWLARDHDLYCRIRARGEVSVAELGMEGCGERELAALGRALRAGAADEAAAGRRVGFAFDPQGLGEDCDWDALFLAGLPLELACRRGALPDLLHGAAGADPTGSLASPGGVLPVLEQDGFVLIGPARD